MFRDDAVALIQARLGARFDARTQGLIESELRLQQDMLEQRTFLPWFLFQEAQMTVNVLDPTPANIALPDGFLREYGEDINTPAFWWLGPEGRWLPVPKRMVMDVYNEDDTPGPPRAYSMMGEYIRLWPAPDQDYSFRLYYFRKDVRLDSNIENDWLRNASQLLWALAGEAVAVNIRDTAAVQYFSGKGQEASVELFRTHVARQEANFDAMAVE